MSGPTDRYVVTAYNVRSEGYYTFGPIRADDLDVFCDWIDNSPNWENLNEASVSIVNAPSLWDTGNERS